MFRFDKMRARCAAILFSLSAALSGCSEGEDITVVLPQSVKMDAPESSSQGEETDRKESVSLTELPEYVFRTGDGHLLLLGNGVSLMNVNTLEMELQREDTGLDFSFQDFRSCKAAVSGDGYLVLGNYSQMKSMGNGMFSSSEEPQLKLVRFDKGLKVLETLNIGEAMGAKRGIDKYDFIDNGKKLFCTSMEGCFLYDLVTGTHTTYPLQGKLHGIYSFGYMESEDKILFAAFYDNGSQKDAQHVLGSMRPDGSDLIYEKKQTHEWGEIVCFENFALIEDDKLHENGEKGSAFYYGADGKIQEYTLADEYTGIQASDTGKYFAVQSRDWAEDGNSTGYTVRVYESESGRLMQEISCPLSEIGKNTMLCECIVSEEAGAVFLLMCDRETKKNARFQVVKLKRD